MRAPGRAQSDEFWIAYAAVEVGHDMELCRLLLRQSWTYFSDAAFRALSTLWELTEREKANRGGD